MDVNGTQHSGHFKNCLCLIFFKHTGITISRTHDPGVLLFHTSPTIHGAVEKGYVFKRSSFPKFGQELKHEAKSMDEEMKREKELSRWMW